MVPLCLHPTLCRWSLLVSLCLGTVGGSDGAKAQLPPPSLRFEPVIADGSFWFHDIAQDATGFLWLGMEGGLTRYDGYGGRHFDTDPGDPSSLPTNFVTDVAPGPDGRLWLALGGEAGWLDPTTGVYTSVTDQRVWHLTFDGAGALWTVHAPTTESLWRVSRWTSEGSTDVAPFGEAAGIHALSGEAPRLAATPDGSIWIPGSTLGLARATQRPDSSYTFTRWGPEAFAADTVRRVIHGGDDHVWVHTERGLHRLSDDSDDRFDLVVATEDLPVEARAFRAFLVDRRGLIWIAPYAVNAVFVFDPASGAHRRYSHRLDDPASLPDARVAVLHEDRNGVLWFGTTEGLYKATPHWDAFQTFLLPAADLAVTLGADRDGGLWTGSICAPTYAFDPADGSFTPAEARLPGFDPPACPMRFLEDRQGRFWIGTFALDGSSGGLVRYDPETRTTKVYRHDPDDAMSPGSRRFRDLLEDRRGRIWIAGEQGLDRYDPATDGFVRHTHDPEDETTLAGPVVWSLAEADDGTLWVGAAGLNRFDPETGLVTRYLPDFDDPAALPTGAITWIHHARREPGILWLGTYDGGLVRFDPATERAWRYTEADGLPDHYVKAVLEDDHGRIWAPTQEGLARLDPATGEIRVFDEAGGLHSRTFGLYDAETIPDGRFVLAHQDALVVFHPDSVESVPAELPLALTAFRIFDRAVPIGATPEAIPLRHDDDFFSFEFAALDFTAPERTRYAYRLDGFDDDWIESGTRRYAAYTNLPPGRYTFRARANSGNGWGANELVVPVVITPAWWQTAWVRLLTVLGLLAMLVAVVRTASTRRLRRQLHALEVEARLQAERERISQDLHDHVGAQLSTIASGIDLARLAGGGDGVASADHLDRLEAHARRTMTQLRETIWALHREAVTIEDFFRRVCAHAREQAALRSEAPVVTCTLGMPSADTARTLSPAQTLHLYRIAQEALENALKHAGATRLSLRLGLEADTLVLDISDDGCFGSPALHDDLGGYGLDGMRRRAEALDGRFELTTDNGTRVCVTVPLASPT